VVRTDERGVVYRCDSIRAAQRLGRTHSAEIEYPLSKYQRSNQDTKDRYYDTMCRSSPGRWPQLKVGFRSKYPSSLYALGRLQPRRRNLISERLVQEDVYTSIHIEKYEIEAKRSSTRGNHSRNLNVGKMPCSLDELIIRVGASGVRDILVGKSPEGNRTNRQKKAAAAILAKSPGCA